MVYSSAVQKIIKQAIEEAKSCKSAFVEPEHLFAAICRKSHTPSFSSSFPNEQVLLNDFFQAGKIRPADLLERLNQEMQYENKHLVEQPCKPSERYKQVLLEAEDYAEDQEGKNGVVHLKYILEQLIVMLGSNPVFRAMVAEVGGDIGAMREYLGLNPQTAIESTVQNDTEVSKGKKHTNPSSTITAIHDCTLDSKRSASKSLPVPVPNTAARTKLSQADEALKQGRWSESIKIYNEALKIFPIASPAWNNLGVAYMRLRQFDESKLALRNAIIHDPNNADAYANMGVLLARDMNNPVDGEKYLVEALKIRPDHPCSLYLESLRTTMRGEDKTFMFRRPKIGQAPEPKDLILPLEKQIEADRLERNGKYTEALAIYEGFLKIYPSSIQVLNNAATVYNRIKNPTKACQLLEKAIRLDPEYIKAWNNLGIAKTMLGDISGAKEAYQNTLKYDPENKIAKHNLQMLLTHNIRNARFMYPPVASPQNRMPNLTRPASTPVKPQSAIRQPEVSLKELQDAAIFELFPKALTRYMHVCIFFGIFDIAVGLALHKTGWLSFMLAGFGAFLAIQGILSNKLLLRGGFLREGYILLGLGLTCIMLFFEIGYAGAGGGGKTPWGQLVLLILLGPFQIRTAFDFFGRHRLFEEMSMKPPSKQILERLEEIRKEIVNAKLDSNLDVIEFNERGGKWKAKLDPKVGIFVNINLGDVLFVARENIIFNQLFPNGPAVMLQIDKFKKTVHMLEPSISRMRKWCHK